MKPACYIERAVTVTFYFSAIQNSFRQKNYTYIYTNAYIFFFFSPSTYIIHTKHTLKKIHIWTNKCRLIKVDIRIYIHKKKYIIKAVSMYAYIFFLGTQTCEFFIYFVPVYVYYYYLCRCAMSKYITLLFFFSKIRKCIPCSVYTHL